MAALAFCHERGVAHGALGAACFLLSTFDDRRAGELVVKLDNFGFARMLRRPVSGSEGAHALPVPNTPTACAWGLLQHFISLRPRVTGTAQARRARSCTTPFGSVRVQLGRPCSRLVGSA